MPPRQMSRSSSRPHSPLYRENITRSGRRRIVERHDPGFFRQDSLGPNMNAFVNPGARHVAYKAAATAKKPWWKLGRR